MALNMRVVAGSASADALVAGGEVEDAAIVLVRAGWRAAWWR